MLKEFVKVTKAGKQSCIEPYMKTSGFVMNGLLNNYSGYESELYINNIKE